MKTTNNEIFKIEPAFEQTQICFSVRNNFYISFLVSVKFRWSYFHIVQFLRCNSSTFFQATSIFCFSLYLYFCWKVANCSAFQIFSEKLKKHSAESFYSLNSFPSPVCFSFYLQKNNCFSSLSSWSGSILRFT